jgi:hypothetical protein
MISITRTHHVAQRRQLRWNTPAFASVVLSVAYTDLEHLLHFSVCLGANFFFFFFFCVSGTTTTGIGAISGSFSLNAVCSGSGSDASSCGVAISGFSSSTLTSGSISVLGSIGVSASGGGGARTTSPFSGKGSAGGGGIATCSKEDRDLERRVELAVAFTDDDLDDVLDVAFVDERCEEARRDEDRRDEDRRDEDRRDDEGGGVSSVADRTSVCSTSSAVVVLEPRLELRRELAVFVDSRFVDGISLVITSRSAVVVGSASLSQPVNSSPATVSKGLSSSSAVSFLNISSKPTELK